MYQRRNRGKPQFNRVPRVFVGAARFILAKVPLVVGDEEKFRSRTMVDAPESGEKGFRCENL
jgi:hypothetical protein